MQHILLTIFIYIIRSNYLTQLDPIFCLYNDFDYILMIHNAIIENI